jgi:hypothetical protein
VESWAWKNARAIILKWEGKQKRGRGLKGNKTVLNECRFALVLLGTILAADRAYAQEPAQEPQKPSILAPSPRCKVESKGSKSAHGFWDKKNDWLFAGVGAARTLDYFSTFNMRRRGRQEIFLTNDAVDNHAAFSAIEVSAVGASIGLSYLFHHYGHHKLERWTSNVHIGLATTGAVRNYCLKTAHPRISP